jgi:HlyD family secretion protein
MRRLEYSPNLTLFKTCCYIENELGLIRYKDMMNKTKIVIFISLLLIIAIIISIFFPDFFTSQNKNLKIFGNVDVRDVSLSFRVSGRIIKMNFDEGDHVTAGTAIANLDQDTYLADLTAAEAELNKSNAALHNAKIIFNRRAKLVKSGAVSKAQFDDATANFDESKARVDDASAKLIKAKIALKDTILYAPSNGTILTRVREVGSVLAATESVYTLSVDDPVWVRTYVEEPDLGKIYPGQKAWVYTDSRPKEPYEGHVGYISPQAEFTPKNVETTQLRTDLVYLVRVVVNNPTRALKQGMPVTVVIEKNQHD